MKNPFAKRPNPLKDAMTAQVMALPENVKVGKSDTSFWLINGAQTIELAPFRGAVGHG